MLRYVEAATRSRRISWLTLLGLILVPLGIGGILLWGTWDTTQRLDQVRAAVVNEDDGTEIDGQVVPMGRQLAAELVKSGDGDRGDRSNYDWVLTDAEDAEAGLSAGRYAAMVTIPENFSAAAVSYSGEPSETSQATIDVRTSDRSRLVDDNISRQLVHAATASLNSTLTTTYLDNLYVGFNTLGDQLGEAADGAHELADGTTRFAAGLDELSDGTTQLAGGMKELQTGTSQLAGGARQLADGLGQLSTGSGQALSGARQLHGGTTELATGTRQFADQLGQLSGGVAVAGGSAAGAAEDTAAVLGSMQAYQVAIEAAFAACQLNPATCVEGIAAAQAVLPSQENLTSLATNVGTTDVALNGSSVLAPGTTSPSLSAGARAAATGAGQLATGANQLADGQGEFVAGLGQLADGVRQSADGARQLSGGATQLSGGVGQAAGGTTQLASGASQLADNAGTLATGTRALADGLTTAVDAIPSYSEAERTQLASVVDAPVRNPAGLVAPFNTSGVALFFVLALWLGGLASYLVLQAVTARALSSTRSSLRLALRGYLPGLLIGLAQGVLVGVAATLLLGLEAGASAAFVALSALAGASFAAVNQGLTGLFGGAGRFASMLIGVVALTEGIVSSVPGVFHTVYPVLPLGQAIDGFQALIDGRAGAGQAVFPLLLWLAIGLLLSVAAVARRRSVRFGTAQVRAVGLA